MAKRGRPDVFTRDGVSEIRDSMISLLDVDTTRGLANVHYQMKGVEIIKEVASEIPFSGLLFQEGDIQSELRGVITCGLKFKKSIAEQIGRMSLQDGFCVEDCVKVAKISAKALHDGYTVKEIEKYIRHGRTTGEW